MDLKPFAAIAIIIALSSISNVSRAVENGALEPFIINGEPANRGEFPVYVLVLIKLLNEERYARCGGTLIAPNKVLTAAHCVDLSGLGFQTIGFSVIPEYYSESDFENLDQRINVISVEPHPDLDLASGTNDIAVMTLDKRLSISPARVFAGTQTLSQNPVSVIGNGLISQTPQIIPRTLQKFNTLIGDNTVCNNFLGFGFDIFVTTHICLKPEFTSASACSGDSGSPLLLSGRGNRVVVGVASFVTDVDCSDSETLTGYTRVSAFTEFIKTHSPETRFTNLADGALPSIIDALLLDDG